MTAQSATLSSVVGNPSPQSVKSASVNECSHTHLYFVELLFVEIVISYVSFEKIDEEFLLVGNEFVSFFNILSRFLKRDHVRNTCPHDPGL